MRAIKVFFIISAVFCIVALAAVISQGLADPVYGVAVICVLIASVLYNLIDLSGGDVARSNGLPEKEQGKRENGDVHGSSAGGNDTGNCGQQIAEGVVLQKMFEVAESGDAVAQCSLGACFQYGNNGVKADMDEAVQWYR